MLALWWSITAQAQYYLYTPQYIDSLQRILTQPVSDSIKARVNFQLATYWISKDTLKARTCIARGRSLAASSPFLIQVANATEAYDLF